jgi:hypothetical protein
MIEAISLGWNCESAVKGVSMGIRNKKANGYTTCPFDECITNYNGVIECLKDDFKYFCDPKYLTIIQAPFSTGGIIKGEYLLYNSRYKFIFNHESPGHANFYLTQNWSGGITHYINNNFEKFIERYERRINNFRKYVSTNPITFIISKFNSDVSLLRETLHITYPSLVFNILHLTPSEPEELVNQHNELMNIIPV